MTTRAARKPRLLGKPVSHQPSSFTIAVAALIALGLALGLSYLAWVAPRGVPFLRYYDVDAQFHDAAQIADLSQVRIAGRDVGQVTGTTYENGHALVRLALFPGQGPLRSDTTARIRLQGLLGGKYVELMPGLHGRELPSGASLPASQTSTAVDLIQFFQAFGPQTRAGLQSSLRGLGEGFLGRGTGIAQMLRTAPGFLNDLATTSGAVLARPGAAARLFPSAQLLAQAFDPVRAQLAGGFAPEDQVMRAILDETPSVQQTLDIAPGSLSALQRGLDAATPLLDQTAGLARASVQITGPAPAALRQTSVLLREAGPALRVTDAPLRTLASDVTPTLGFLRRIDPVIGPALTALAKSVPLLDQLGRHGCDVLSFAANWRSALAFGVVTGTGSLQAGVAGLGPLTSLRVLPVRLLSYLNADAPVSSTPPRDPYPAPCVSTGEHS